MTFHPEIKTLVDTLPFHARRRGEKLAIVGDSSACTYAELDRRSNQVARALQAEGTPRHARVAYFGHDSEHFHEVLFGCAKSGAVLVPINWRLAPEEVRHILKDAAARLLFVDAALRDLVAPALAEQPALEHVIVLDDAEDVRGFSRWRDAHSDAALTAEATPDDPVLQLYTSGTTGLPKGAVLAHRSFFAVRDALHAADLGWIDFRPDDVSFSMVPYFHVGGVWWSVQGLNAGITNVCMRSFSPGKALELVQRHRVTQVALVPAMLQMLLHERGASPEALASLRKVIYGGAPISEGLLAQASARLRAEFVQLYGLTESGNTALCLPPDGHRPGSSLRISAGRPYPGFAVRIVDSAGRELPHGQVGEVCLRTQGVMIGYWNNPEATAKTLRDGWLFTGDAGYLDEGGHLFLCDRIKDCIIAAGENIYPAEVDNALRTIPGVRDAATIGIPDERWGEAVMAYVVEESAGSLNARACMLALKGKIADYKIPRAYAFVDQIPRNASGKILRRVLREQHWAGYERRVN